MFQVPESLRRVDPWDATVEIGGAHFQALAVPTSTYERLLIVNGLPAAYRDDLLVGAQESPHKHTWRVIPDAQRYDHLTFTKVLNDNLKIMDAAAVALCRDNRIPIVVFNIRQPGNLAKVLSGKGMATIVQDGE